MLAQKLTASPALPGSPLAAKQLEFCDWGMHFTRGCEIHDVAPDVAILRKYSIMRCLGTMEFDSRSIPL